MSVSRLGPYVVSFAALLALSCAVARANPGVGAHGTTTRNLSNGVTECHLDSSILHASIDQWQPNVAVIFDLIGSDDKVLAHEWAIANSSSLEVPLLWSSSGFNKGISKVVCREVTHDPDAMPDPQDGFECRDADWMHVDEGPTGDFMAVMWGESWIVARAATSYASMISGVRGSAPYFFGVSLDGSPPKSWNLIEGRESFSLGFFGLSPGKHSLTLGTREPGLPVAQSNLFPLDRFCVTL